MTNNCDRFYIDGEWVFAATDHSIDIINPANEQSIGRVFLGDTQDVDSAVKAASRAFESWSQSSKQERLAVLDRIIEVYQSRLKSMAEAITLEMGAPAGFALDSQAPMGLVHFQTSRDALESYEFEQSLGKTHIFKEAIGVCGFITPWNWPMNQIACKVAPALACGCTVVLKPSEFAPLSAKLFAEILDEARVPKGVFNLVYGDGPTVGAALSAHPDVEMVSLTGSTRAGIQVSCAAAETIKRVTLELGGKSANILLPDCNFDNAVKEGVIECFRNTGQSCNAPTRMLVSENLHERAVKIAIDVANKTIPGDPTEEPADPEYWIGPLSNKGQFSKVQSMIQMAIDEGSELVAGGIGRPDGIEKGYFVKPTVFANVKNDSMIAQQEVFGPVLAILPYRDEEDAIEIANDSPYGLASYVQSGDIDKARSIARRLHTGNVFLNGNNYDPIAPFGGYKQSGNGREWGDFAFDDFLEIKGVVGY